MPGSGRPVHPAPHSLHHEKQAGKVAIAERIQHRVTMPQDNGVRSVLEINLTHQVDITDKTATVAAVITDQKDATRWNNTGEFGANIDTAIRTIDALQQQAVKHRSGSPEQFDKDIAIICTARIIKQFRYNRLCLRGRR